MKPTKCRCLSFVLLMVFQLTPKNIEQSMERKHKLNIITCSCQLDQLERKKEKNQIYIFFFCFVPCFRRRLKTIKRTKDKQLHLLGFTFIVRLIINKNQTTYRWYLISQCIHHRLPLLPQSNICGQGQVLTLRVQSFKMLRLVRLQPWEQ